jgi:hypothetical protein
MKESRQKKREIRMKKEWFENKARLNENWRVSGKLVHTPDMCFDFWLNNRFRGNYANSHYKNIDFELAKFIHGWLYAFSYLKMLELKDISVCVCSSSWAKKFNSLNLLNAIRVYGLAWVLFENHVLILQYVCCVVNTLACVCGTFRQKFGHFFA